MKVQRDTFPKSSWRPLGSALLFAAMAVKRRLTGNNFRYYFKILNDYARMDTMDISTLEL